MDRVQRKDSFEKRLVWVLRAFLLVELIFLTVSNLFLQRERMDCDSAKLYVHVIEMWKNRTFFIPGWSYITTLELDCPAILAMPLFGLTGNIYIAFGISNLLFALLLIWVLYQIFQGKSAVYPLVSAILILLPYRTGQLDYYNMMFFNGGQYTMKVMLPLILVALLIQNKSGRPGKREVFLAVLYGFFVFLSGCSGGMYVFACGLFPVLAGYLLCQLFSGGKPGVRYWIYGAGTLALAGGGMLVNVLIGAETKGMQMNLVNIADGFEGNFFAVLVGIFELFGGAAYGSVSVMSGHGINILIRIGYVFVLLYCVARSVKRLLNKKGDVLSGMLAAVFVWNLLILLLCDTRYGSATYEYRYHLMGMIPAMCLAAGWFAEGCLEQGGFFGRALSWGSALLFLFLAATSVKGFLEYKTPMLDQLESICEYADNRNVEEVYVFYDSQTPELMRLIDYEGPVYLLLRNFDGGLMAYDYYEKYVNGTGRLDGAVVVVRNDSGAWEEVQVMGEYRLVRTMLLEDFSVYECARADLKGNL